ncbi:MAG: hypothetical protein FWC94_00255 [Bacteroidales bacterium]|nr:hypothetical protein [Bacteroidales bacterium]
MKIVLKITTLSVVLLIISTSHALTHEDNQDYARRPLVTVDSTFQLSSFILPDFRRRALTIDGSLSNNLRSERGRHKLLNSAYASYSVSDFTNIFLLNPRVMFSDIHYTRNRQRETYISSSIVLDAFRSNSESSTATLPNEARNSFWFSPDFRFSQSNRHYLNESLFVGYTPSIWYRNILRRNSRKQENGKFRDKRFSQDLISGVTFEIGLGRIEPVGDASHAIQIFDALARRNITSATKSPEDIIRFAEFIAKLKNKRFLDARHRKIYELEALDSFLFANGFRDTLSASYFATLEDFWVHGRPFRSSGTRWSFYITPSYAFSSNTVDTRDSLREEPFRIHHRNNSNALYTAIGIQLARERPINLFWQNSISSSLEFQHRNIRGMWHTLYNTNNPSERLVEYSSNSRLMYELHQQISYYPTSRTSFFVRYGLRYDFLPPIRREFRGYNNHFVSVNIGSGASYFFSPQLQLNFETSLRYHFEQYHDFNTAGDFFMVFRERNSNFEFHFNLSLRYTFF